MRACLSFNMVQTLILGAVLLLSTALSSEVWAHQQKAGVTTLVYNPRTNMLEIMHRLYMHDAEHAVKRLFAKDADILKNPTTQTQFANYVAERFGLYLENEALPMQTVGYEVDGRFFWVYQETAKPETLEKLSIRHQVLHDIWPAQNNLLNIEGIGPVQSFEFTDKQALMTVQF